MMRSGSMAVVLRYLGCVATLLATSALAQSAFPTKSVRVLVPYGVGSGVDVAARIMSEGMAKNLGQAFVIENRPGAAGSIATAAVLTQPGDGHTLLTDTSSHTITPALMSLPYDTLRDFVGVTTLVENPLILVTGGGRNIRTLAELITLGKGKAGGLTYGSAGIGTTSHIGAEKFRFQAGLQGLHAPFKSTTDGLIEVMAGRIDFIVTAVASVQAGLSDGKLVALALNSRRNAALPNVPFIEEVVPGSGYVTWIGIIVSSKTPRDLVTRLNREIAKAMTTPEAKERLAKVGTEPWIMSAEDFEALRRREVAENAKLIKDAGIKMQ